MDSSTIFPRSPRGALLRAGIALVAFLALLGADTMLAPSAAACETYVSGYYRADGRYVSGHHRTCANSSVSDNWSTRGNVNPYTGQPGYRSYDVPTPSYTPSYRRSYDGGYSAPRYRSSSWGC